MWRPFQASLISGRIQCVAVSLVIFGILLAARHELINLAPPDAGANADAPGLAHDGGWSIHLARLSKAWRPTMFFSSTTGLKPRCAR